MVNRLLGLYDVITFDFVGCGLSKGEYVTLGLNESKDLEGIINHVYKNYEYEDIYLWGRSMGAVCILHMLFAMKMLKKEYRDNENKIDKYKKDKVKLLKPTKKLSTFVSDLSERNKKIKETLVVRGLIKGLVLDAPFTCAYKMISNIVKRQANTNSLTTYIAMQYLKRSLRSNVGRDIITENKPETLVKYIDVPAAFLLGEHDELIGVDDFMNMFNNYGAEYKRFRLMVDTDHAASRNDEDLDAGFRFIEDMHSMVIERKESLKKHQKELDVLADTKDNDEKRDG